MTRGVARTIVIALVLVVAAGTWWLIKPSTQFVPTKTAISSYGTQAVGVSSQQGAPQNPNDLVLYSPMLASDDKGLQAQVVKEAASTVTVAMNYQKFECKGCARNAMGLTVAVTVHLHAPLGTRAVIDNLTHRAVKYQQHP